MLEDQAAGLTLNELMQRVSLPRSTVQRIVAALLAEDLLAVSTVTNRIRLGPAFVRHGIAAGVDVERAAMPILTTLSQCLNETVDFSLLSGGRAVFIAQVVGTHRLRTVSSVGDSFPLHCSANGKALLAMLPPSRVDRLLDRPLETFTSQTVTDPENLRLQLDEVRKTGLAWNREEHSEGICAIGAGFLDANGNPYALSIPVPTARFERMVADIVPKILDARRRLVEEIGGFSFGPDSSPVLSV